MHNEIRNIRKNIIDKIIVISFIFFTPAYIAVISRWGEIGWQNINIIDTCFFIFLVLLLIFRKRLSTESKVYSVVFVYSAMGIASLWYLGFSSIHYFVIIAIATGSILAKRKTAFIFISTIALLYIIVGILYMLHIQGTSVELNSFSHSILPWTTIILSLIAISAIFVEGFGELYHRLVNTIEENRRIQNTLKKRNQELTDKQEELAKKVEESHEVNLQLQISEEKYRKLVSYLPNVIYWYSTLEGGLFYSERLEEMLGYRPEEIERKPGFWQAAVHPKDRAVLKKTFENFDPKSRYDLTYRVKTKSGDWKWLSDTLTTLKYTSEEIIFQGQLTDITSEKEIKEKLKDSEMRWHFSVDGSNLGLWDWNIITNKVFFSKQWKKMLGFQDDEVADDLNEWKNRVHPDDLESVMDILNAYLGGKNEIYSSEHRMLCKNGSYKWILDRGKIVSYTKDGKPKRMIGTHADITEQKLAELELKKSNATKDRFFSIIAHDLKNPFNSMIGLSEALNENFEEIDKKTQRKFITAIHEGILKTYDLLEELLLWSRAQQNTIDFFPKPVDLLMVLTEVLEPLHMAVENKSIEIILEIPSGTIVLADRFMLSFVLRNIISNALKFTPRNGKITIERSMLDRNGKRSIQIVIHDTGIGIEKSYLERIFDIGQNVSRPGTENEKGTGMGLPICYEFVKKHGGDIWVESKPNKGSHFFVTWPVEEN